MKASDVFKMTATGEPRIDWRTKREGIDLAAVATNLLGAAHGCRHGRLWWRCPLGAHQDGNPSFAIKPGGRWWRCYGCGEHGDAAALVMKLKGITFPEAVRYLAGDLNPSGRSKSRPQARHDPKPPAPAEPSGMAPETALALVEAATARLWTPEGAAGLAYLRGRGLRDETIRAGRLGMEPRGIVIPWFVRDVLVLVKIRQRRGREPKYLEVYRDRERYAGIYPGPQVIRPGRPLIVAEGELDALLLDQALGELAAVVTLGSASARPDAGILGAMLAAAPWYVATDADPAGDAAAAAWGAFPRARRVRPPGPYKDWTEAAAGGVDLRNWWELVLGPLGALLSKLNARGVRLDGRLVHPQIAVGTVTGRVTYSGIDPPPQGIPEAERPRRIGPIVEGRVFVRADYGQIEPRILLASGRRKNAHLFGIVGGGSVT